MVVKLIQKEMPLEQRNDAESKSEKEQKELLLKALKIIELMMKTENLTKLHWKEASLRARIALMTSAGTISMPQLMLLAKVLVDKLVQAGLVSEKRERSEKGRRYSKAIERLNQALKLPATTPELRERVLVALKQIEQIQAVIPQINTVLVDIKDGDTRIINPWYGLPQRGKQKKTQ